MNYWASRGGYGAWIKGRQHILAVGPRDEATYSKAMKEYAALLEHAPAAKDDNTMRRILDDYLVHLRDYGAAPKTIQMRLAHFQVFCDYGVPARLRRLQALWTW